MAVVLLFVICCWNTYILTPLRMRMCVCVYTLFTGRGLEILINKNKQKKINQDKRPAERAGLSLFPIRPLLVAC